MRYCKYCNNKGFVFVSFINIQAAMIVAIRAPFACGRHFLWSLNTLNVLLHNYGIYLRMDMGRYVSFYFYIVWCVWGIVLSLMYSIVSPKWAVDVWNKGLACSAGQAMEFNCLDAGKPSRYRLVQLNWHDTSWVDLASGGDWAELREV